MPNPYDKVLWPKANPTNREVLMEMFKERGMEGINLVVERTDRGGLFFSEEAVEDLFDKVISLVAANMMRHYEEKGRPPFKMEVEVNVRIDA